MTQAIDEWVAIDSTEYWVLLGLVLFARGCDLGSTYLATPNLRLEANPMARKLGWRYGIPANLLLSFLFAAWPLLALSMTTISWLVAARNLQSAWLMRSLGEVTYRRWIAERAAQCPRGLPLFCCLGEAALFGAIGVALLWFGQWQLVPFAVGLGLVGYAVAVAFYTSLALTRSYD